MRSVEAIDLTIVRPGARTAGEVTVTWPLPHRGGALSVVLLDADTGAFLAAPQFGGVQVVGDREVVNFPLDPDRKLPEEVDLVVLEDVTPLLRRTVVLPPV